MLRTQFGVAIKIVITNNGGESFSKPRNELYEFYGIIHQSSFAYTPQQNGVVKKKA